MIVLHSALILVLAFLLDIIVGDPPNRFHPVAWMGSSIAWYRRNALFGNKCPGDMRRFLSGLTLILVGVTLTASIGWTVQRFSHELPVLLSVLLQAVLLKCTFSARSLARAARSVSSALDSKDIPLARQQVAYHLVSRDVSTLEAADLSAATIESVAENTSDSIVAPLLFFALAGLPGALVYRFVNTCDAMLGYRTAELEWFGKPAARFDDLLNLIPSRLTALLMLSVGVAMGFASGAGRAVKVWWRDHALTASPNAGHPMSAAAGILGVRLEKHGHYRLGADLPAPCSLTIAKSIKLLWGTAVLAVLLLGSVSGLREWLL